MFAPRSLTVVAIVAVALTACKKKPVEVAPAPVQNTPTQTTPVGPDTAAERIRREQAERDRLAAATREASAAARAALTEMVFFDYDQSAIRDDARSTLDRKVAILRANPNVTLRIEGHADERGSVEYNLALSLRRATSIRDYLAGFGIDASRFEVVPMGEERPLDSSASESAFQRNRRGEFVITRGGDNLVSPR